MSDALSVDLMAASDEGLDMWLGGIRKAAEDNPLTTEEITEWLVAQTPHFSHEEHFYTLGLLLATAMQRLV